MTLLSFIMLTYFACFSSKPKPSKRAKAKKPVADPSADEPVIDPSTAVPPEGTPAAPVDEPALETPAAEDVQDHQVRPGLILLKLTRRLLIRLKLKLLLLMHPLPLMSWSLALLMLHQLNPPF